MVRIDPPFQACDPALVQGVSATFEPGARAAWHIHPLGQTLIVTAAASPAEKAFDPLAGDRRRAFSNRFLLAASSV
jgi:hypothetical protein